MRLLELRRPQSVDPRRKIGEISHIDRPAAADSLGTADTIDILATAEIDCRPLRIGGGYGNAMPHRG